MAAGASFSCCLPLALVLTPANPRINRLLIETPDPTDPDSGNFPFSGVLADGDFVELEILGDFLCGHYLGHWAGPPGVEHFPAVC